MSVMPAITGKIIYHWTVPPDYKNNHEIEDLADEYIIEENKELIGACFIHARYKDRWITNPWSTRALIKHLIDERNKLLTDIQSVSAGFCSVEDILRESL